MEDIILYPGEEKGDSHLTTRETKFEEIRISGGIQTGIGVANSTGSRNEKIKTEMKNEEYGLIAPDSGSDVEEEFHAVMESMKHEETAVQAEEIKTVCIAPPVLPEIRKTSRSEQSLQDEKSFPPLCRLCAIPSSDTIYIFGSTILHEKILEKIQHCLPITVKKNDTLSKKVCSSCLQKLESCYQFHITVTEAEKQLLVFHEQTSGRLTGKRGIHYQTSQCNGQLVIIESADNKETSIKGSNWDAKNTESNQFSYLDKDNGTRDSNCEIQNTEPFMDTLNSGRTSASESRQDNCDAALNSPIGELHAAEELKSDNGVADSVNHLPPKIKNQSKPRLKTCIVPSERYSYSSRKRKDMEYNSDNDDGLSRDEVIDSHAPAAKKVRRQLIECHICKTTLQTIEKCHTHARSHASTNYYPCCFCNIISKTESEWKEHWSQHDGNAYSPKIKRKPLLYSCEVCGRKYAGKNTLENHKLHHQRRVNNEHHRQTCDKVSNSETPLQQHLISVHEKCEPSSANICGTQFRNEKELNADQEEHMFRCTRCKKKLSSNASLERHKKLCHDNRKKYICDYCKRIYCKKRTLRRHMLIHIRERPFSCDFCPKSYMSENSRDNHHKIHTRKRPFLCDICPKSFACRYIRDNHLRVHTGERPFSCDICSKSFRTRNTRDDHRRIHTGERPHTCDICSKSFTTKQARDVHQTSHWRRTFQL